VEQSNRESGIRIECLPFLSYVDLMRLHGQARFSIALSTSDGLSASLIETMLMGSLPIQSNTGCFEEWASSRSMLLVNPEEVEEVSAAVDYALANDRFVDEAAARNDAIAAARFDAAVVNPEIIAMYERAYRLAMNRSSEPTLEPR
jgi:glycosyltransferase involved in cell wall biosynthesis